MSLFCLPTVCICVFSLNVMRSYITQTEAFKKENGFLKRMDNILFLLYLCGRLCLNCQHIRSQWGLKFVFSDKIIALNLGQ